MPSTFFDIDCGGETVTIEKTDDGDFIFHGWDEETELAAIELGFESSLCWMFWNAINEDNDDEINEELLQQSHLGNTLVVKALLFAGANIETTNFSGWTPLHYAACYGRTDIVNLLIKAGASVDAKAWDGRTPLYAAAANDHADVAKILLEAGASVDARTKSGKTPLKLALDYTNTSVVKVINDWIEEHGE